MKSNLNKLLIAIAILCAMFVVVACGSSTTSEPLSLDGTWKQIDGDTSYQQAVIEGDYITINWVDEEDKSESLYWAGSVDAPGEDVTTDSEYTWDSINDKEKTDVALLASGSDSKTFTYKDGIISYKASALGTTKTMELKKVEE